MRAEELTEPESALWDAFPAARTVDLGGRGEVRAEVIAALLSGARPPEPGRVPAVRLTGAKITGTLDLSFADVPYAALLRDCEFAERPSLYGARLRQVNLSGSRLPGLQASDARVDGLLWLEGCRFDGSVLLVGTQVDGTLSLASARIDAERALQAGGLTVARDLIATDLTVSGSARLRGARVRGAIVLDRARLSCPGGVALELDRARVEGAVALGDGLRAEGMVSLRSAVIGGVLELDRAELINPSGMALRGHLLSVGSSLRAASVRVTGQVYLDAAHITGSINLDGARLSNPGGIALRASRAEITGGLFGKYGFVSDGAIHLVDTRVGASVDLSGARITAPGAVALKARGVSVGGAVNCGDGFTAVGEVSIEGGTVRDSLDLDGARLSNPGGSALSADRIEVGGTISGKGGLTVEGEIRLLDARVGASVEFNGAALSNPGGRTLTAWGVEVGRVVDCCDGFTADGRISFAGAKVGGQVCFADARIDASVALRGARADNLRLTEGTRISGPLDLRHATITVLHDHPAGWPAETLLAGFTYDSFDTSLSAADRVAWLDGAATYQPQPYEQLAAVYRRLGQDADARTVQLARQRHRRRTLPRWLAVWSLVQDWTVGYGYRPQRAVLWLAGLLLVGVAAFGAHHPPPLKAGEAPPFNPVLYTLDLLLPIIGFGQEAAYAPRGWQQWLAAALVASGWILATTIATGVTRVLSRQ
ncbi:translocation/assembly module TamB domain-containing protein [Actinoallomurus rhizosphaericola]|uniref:hypothetical protein n=1 Tax=Actinoallomurus rhizosphaericola TaxID=2952536 RepID=UPI002093697C|nr:hypothetical protein [Actinoallomurus rhizosphaericola]MCO5997573.1 hypothetical protein [Actinoallomurus rhizosphaericola]